MTTRVIAAIFLLVAVGLGTLLFPGPRALVLRHVQGYLGQHTAAPAKAPGSRVRTVPVRVAKVIAKSIPIELEGVGRVKARSIVQVKSQIDGQLIKAVVREGQLVKVGDILFQLDPRPLQARLKEAEAALASARANEIKAAANLKRLSILLAQGHSPASRIEDARAELETEKANIRSTTAAVELANLNLNYATIRSPIDGRAGDILVSVGNIIKANDSQPLLIITQTKPILVSFALPERYIYVLRKRLAREPMQVSVTTQADPDTVDTGELFFINNQVDPTTGTIELLARFDNKDERLVPGQFVRAKVLLSTLRNAAVVPTRAVQINQTGHFVWIVGADEKVTLRPVTVGHSDDQISVIDAGVKIGETVVTDGQLRLYAGAKVKVAVARQKPRAELGKTQP